MFCEKCGTQLPDGSTFCTACGAQLNAPAAPQAAPAQPVSAAPAAKAPNPGIGLAIAGMVLGIISFLCFPMITGVLAIIFGAVAKSKGCTSGMATAGIVCGVIGVALWLLMLIACDGTALLFADMLDF